MSTRFPATCRVSSSSSLLALAGVLFVAAASAAEPLPQALRIPTHSSDFGTRFALVSVDGRLLRQPDFKGIRGYTRVGDAILPAPAQAIDGRWGYIDPQGKWVVTPQFKDARSFSEDGMARVQQGEKWGYIDRDLKLAIPPRYENVGPFYGGLGAFVQKGKWGYLDTQGKVVIAPKFDVVNNFGTNGLARARLNEKDGFIDRTGAWKLKPVWSQVDEFGPDGTAPATLDGENWGLIDGEGKWVLKPSYRWIRDFGPDGFAKFSDSSYKDGLMDGRGRVVVEVREEVNGMPAHGVVRTGGLGDSSVRFIDLKTGKPVGPEVFDWAESFAKSGLTVARRKGQWGIVDRQGRFTAMARHYEPLAVDDMEIIGFHETEGLSPWLSRDGGVDWLDGAGKVVFQLRRQPAPGKDKTTLRLADGTGRSLWESAPISSVWSWSRQFDPSAEEMVFKKKNWEGGLADVARQLLAKPAKPFMLAWQDEENFYDLGDMDEEEIAEAPRGAATALAGDYVSETEWGRYYFLQDQRHEQFKRVFEHFRAQLEKAYGSPGKFAPKDQISVGRGDHTKEAAWQVGDRRLILSWSVQYGDGDFKHQVALSAVVPPAKKAQ